VNGVKKNQGRTFHTFPMEKERHANHICMNEGIGKLSKR